MRYCSSLCGMVLFIRLEENWIIKNFLLLASVLPLVHSGLIAAI